MDQAAQARALSSLSDFWPTRFLATQRRAKRAALLYLHDQLRSNLTANGVRHCTHQAKFLKRFIVIDREHVRDPERAGVSQFFRADT
jgi:hypothetical protein